MVDQNPNKRPSVTRSLERKRNKGRFGSLYGKKIQPGWFYLCSVDLFKDLSIETSARALC